MVAGAAVQKPMMKIQDEQEILMNIADMAIETLKRESTPAAGDEARKRRRSRSAGEGRYDAAT